MIDPRSSCDHALVGSHIKRNPDQAKLHEDLGPITFVHSDFAESYGDMMREFYAGSDIRIFSELKDGTVARHISLQKEPITPIEIVLDALQRGPRTIDVLQTMNAISAGALQQLATPLPPPEPEDKKRFCSLLRVLMKIYRGCEKQKNYCKS